MVAHGPKSCGLIILLLQFVRASSSGSTAHGAACQAEEPLVFQATEFVPSRHCYVSGGIGSSSLQEDNICLQDLLADVRELQNAPCQQVMTAGLMEGGFGSTLHVMALFLQRSKKMGRGVVFIGACLYAACERQDVTCVWCNATGCPLQAFSRCQLPATSENEHFDAVMRAQATHASAGAWAPDDAFGLCFKGQNALFRYVSALVGYLFSPNPSVVERVASLAHEIGLPEEYLGVHIRHGDSCTALHAHTQEGQAAARGYDEFSQVLDDAEEGKNLEKRCVALPTFAHALSRLSESLGISNVFVATDNPEAVKWLRQLLPNMLIFANPNVDRQFMSEGVQGQLSSAKEELALEIHKKMKHASSDKRQEHLDELLYDALILARSKGFVGQFRSHLSRFFFELASHEQGRVIPYISTDGSPWCWGQGLWTDKSTGAGRMEDLVRCW